MKYKQRASPSLSVPPASGAQVGAPPAHPVVIPWQPSTWPSAPTTVEANFIATLEKIFKESILDEIGNVIEDAKKSNGDLQHRGHVVAISLMCALDAISAYGYRGKHGKHIAKFVRNHFPPSYQAYAADIYKMYRNSLVHSWNLFEAAILPGNEGIQKTNRALSFGLLNFFEALQMGVKDFLKRLESDTHLRTNTLNRYKKLKKTAKP
jgi:hypothetical protein